MNKYLTCAIIFLSLVLVSCAEDDEPEWKASEVCPEVGTNRYGMPNRGTFTDERDGRVYKYTTIGDQVWMAENLKYELPNPYSTCYGKEFCTPRGHSMNDTVMICNTDTSQLAKIAERLHSTCETNECIADEFCEKYGRYYTLMKDAKFDGGFDRDLMDTVCPKGWHVPTRTEWETLIESVGAAVPRLMSESAYDALDSTTQWLKGGSGPVDACGFSAVYPGYYYTSGNLNEMFVTVHYICSTYYRENAPDVLWIYDDFRMKGGFTKQSLRCIKD